MGRRNEEIAKKSLEAKTANAAYAYASNADVRMHPLTWTTRPRPETEHGRAHLKLLCRVVTLCLGYGLKCVNDLSCRSLRATDGRNRAIQTGIGGDHRDAQYFNPWPRRL
ncbi:hypothetical protein PIB30_040036 [Stylosanthes scabra]|uniref:Uncharacterized protein n=1 Tax=Stylosanthes scabra TaxID=79078 RepID=A0ABU6SEE1_9FABA|nr:hypothetical protein [Stylosanthes scabra]